jgi:hypothetical protein
VDENRDGPLRCERRHDRCGRYQRRTGTGTCTATFTCTTSKSPLPLHVLVNVPDQAPAAPARSLFLRAGTAGAEPGSFTRQTYLLWGRYGRPLLVRAALRGPARRSSMPTDFAPVSAPALTAPLFAGAALLDAEKLDCYRLAVEFQTLAAPLLRHRGTSSLRSTRSRQRLDRTEHRRGRRPLLARRQDALLRDRPRERDGVRRDHGRHPQPRVGYCCHLPSWPSAARAHHPDADSASGEDDVPASVPSGVVGSRLVALLFDYAV